MPTVSVRLITRTHCRFYHDRVEQLSLRSCFQKQIIQIIPDTSVEDKKFLCSTWSIQ